jgi:hypothetical protein
MTLDISAELVAKIENRAAALFARDHSALRSAVLEALEAFGAESGAQKLAVVQSLLAGEDADAAALSLPWALEQRQLTFLEAVRRSLNPSVDDQGPTPTSPP